LHRKVHIADIILNASVSLHVVKDLIFH
jgi:hypothetical protein